MVTVERGAPIRIAVITAQTNSYAAQTGIEQLRGARLAASDFGEINQSKVEIVIFDTTCSLEQASQAARVLTNDTSIVAAVGHTCSETCLYSTPIYEQANVSIVSPSCSARSLTEADSHIPIFFRTVLPTRTEAAQAASFAYRELGARRAAILYDGTIEQTELTTSFEAAFARQGGITVINEMIEDDTTDFEATLNTIVRADVDLIYAPVNLEEAHHLLLNRESVQQAADIPVLGGRYYWSAQFFELVKGSTEGIYAVGPNLTSDQIENILAQYLDRYKEPPYTTAYAQAYDAMSIILEAIETSSQIDQANRLVIGRKALNEALYQTTAYHGLSGTITCTEWGDCGAETLAIGRIINNEWVTIYVP